MLTYQNIIHIKSIQPKLQTEEDAEKERKAAALEAASWTKEAVFLKEDHQFTISEQDADVSIFTI